MSPSPNEINKMKNSVPRGYTYVGRGGGPNPYRGNDFFYWNANKQWQKERADFRCGWFENDYYAIPTDEANKRKIEELKNKGLSSWAATRIVKENITPPKGYRFGIFKRDGNKEISALNYTYGKWEEWFGVWTNDIAVLALPVKKKKSELELLREENAKLRKKLAQINNLSKT